MSAGTASIDTAAALQLRSVSYAYPGQSGGVRDVSLAAEPGALYALIGENGAGKTTLMRLMLGLLTPTSGEVLVGGAPLRRDPALLASIGSLIETPSLYLHLTGEEHLRVFAIYYGLGRTAVGRALETVGLGAAAATLVKRYSLGMKQRLGIATALLHEPAILVLDEPMNGLDPAGMAELRELLAGLAARGKTVIVSSHLLSEVERSASRIAIIHRGALRFEGRPEEFRRSRGSGAGVLLRVADAPAAVLQLEAGGHVCATQGDAVVVRDVPESQVGDLVRALAAAGHDIRSVETVRPSLEDEYLALLREAPDA